MVARPGLVVLLAVLSTTAVRGHHSFSAYYYEDQSVSITGAVVEFEYRNPHAWVHVLAVDQRGQTQKYGAEWGSPARLRGRGVTKDTLRPGDQVILTGSPSRTPSDYKLHLKRIERPADGWKWEGGPQQR
jgi:Family of unknown function (DUF6152)